jgi:hypothetical protein
MVPGAALTTEAIRSPSEDPGMSQHVRFLSLIMVVLIVRIKIVRKRR